MPKPNATLIWEGRKLMCKSVCVADIAIGTIWRGGLPFPGFFSWIGTAAVPKQNSQEATARRAINRRFGLPANFGE